MKVVSIIPARGGSKGIPRKNLAPVAGKPLLVWTVEQSVRARLVDATFVSTDDEEIASVATASGAQVIWRPTAISGDTATSEEALEHALAHLRDDAGVVPEWVVFLQATSPLRRPGDIDGALRAAQEANVDSLFSGAVCNDFLLWHETPEGLRSINYDFSDRRRRQVRQNQFVENGSIYVFRPQVLREHANRLGGAIGFYRMEAWQTWEIDDEEDIELVEFYMQKLKEDWHLAHLATVTIEAILFDFDGVLTDNRALVNEEGVESVFVSRADGLGIEQLRRLGYEVAIISTETNPVVAARARKLGVPCVQGVKDKEEALEEFCRNVGTEVGKTMFIGNDVNDLTAMRRAGLAVCPADAHPEVKNISTVVLTRRGGEGVARELYDLITKARARE